MGIVTPENKVPDQGRRKLLIAALIGGVGGWGLSKLETAQQSVSCAAKVVENFFRPDGSALAQDDGQEEIPRDPETARQGISDLIFGLEIPTEVEAMAVTAELYGYYERYAFNDSGKWKNRNDTVYSKIVFEPEIPNSIEPYSIRIERADAEGVVLREILGQYLENSTEIGVLAFYGIDALTDISVKQNGNRTIQVARIDQKDQKKVQQNERDSMTITFETEDIQEGIIWASLSANFNSKMQVDRMKIKLIKGEDNKILLLLSPDRDEYEGLYESLQMVLQDHPFIEVADPTILTRMD